MEYCWMLEKIYMQPKKFRLKSSFGLDFYTQPNLSIGQVYE